MLKPRCVKGIAPAYCSTGHILPCCYIDGVIDRDETLRPLFSENLKIEHHDDITTIYQSDEWVDFFDVLINRPEDASPKCWAICGRENMNDTNAMQNNRYTLTGEYYGKGYDLRDETD